MTKMTIGFFDVALKEADRRDREEAEWLKRCPKCEKCGEPIQDDFLFDIGGELYHVDCAEELFRKSANDYIDEE